MNKQQLAREWAIRRVGCPYLMGGTGQPCTPAYRSARAAQYPASAEKIFAACQRTHGSRTASCKGCRYYDEKAGRGMPAYDCAQLTRRCMESVGISLVSGSDSQYRKTAWRRQGAAEAIPEKEVCLVYRYDAGTKKYGHTGIYLGDGTVVHAKGHAYGVVREPLRQTAFTHFGVPPGLDEPLRTLRPGDRGMDVEALQRLLMDAGFSLPRWGADGSFGEETAQALRAFQKSRGLAATGKCDVTVWQALEAQSPAPAEEAELSLPALRALLLSALELLDQLPQARKNAG